MAIIIIIVTVEAAQGKANSRENATTVTSQATKKKIAGASQAKSTSDPPNLEVKPRAEQENLVAQVKVLKS